jgi:hypothetical protein
MRKTKNFEWNINGWKSGELKTLFEVIISALNPENVF